MNFKTSNNTHLNYSHYSPIVAAKKNLPQGSLNTGCSISQGNEFISYKIAPSGHPTLFPFTWSRTVNVELCLNP